MNRIKKIEARKYFLQLVGAGLFISGYIGLIINSLPNQRLPLIIIFFGWFIYNREEILKKIGTIVITIGSEL